LKLARSIQTQMDTGWYMFAVFGVARTSVELLSHSAS